MFLAFLLLWLPIGGFAQDLRPETQAYLALLERYAQGDIDSAARAMLDLESTTAWPVAQVAAGERQPPALMRRRLQLMLLVHTEAGLGTERPHQQFRIAGHVADRLWTVPEPARSSLRPLVRDWYLLVASHLATLHQFEVLKQHLARGLARFKGDPELLLARGSVYEAEASVADRSLPSRLSTSPDTGGRRRRLQSARRDFERAYGAQADLLEARLRWGRVQGRLGEVVPAVSALGDVASSGAPAFLRYLALIFRTELSERAGNIAAARDDYQAALGVWPRSWAPRVALNRLCGAEGDAECAQAWLSKDLAVTPNDEDDPLSRYLHGQAWRRDERLASLRLLGMPQ